MDALTLARRALVVPTLFLCLVDGTLRADDVDTSLFPNGYGVLVADPYVFPVGMGDWPAKIDGAHQLFVDDALIKSISGLRREYHKL